MAEFRFPSGILRCLLAPLMVMGDDANLFFDPNRGLRLKLVCFVGYVDAAVFFRKESLGNFVCPKPASACLELMALGKALSQIGTNDLIDLHFDTEDELVLRLRTAMSGPSTPERMLLAPREERRIDVALMEERNEFMKIDESKFIYDLVVGIPSVKFMQVLKDVNKHSEFVTIYVREKQVLFRVKNKSFNLHKELGQFVSAGPTFTHAVPLNFSLFRIKAFLSASELSSMVWMCWSLDAPPLLSFPVGSLGNIHVYSRFAPEKKPRIADCIRNKRLPAPPRPPGF